MPEPFRFRLMGQTEWSGEYLQQKQREQIILKVTQTKGMHYEEVSTRTQLMVNNKTFYELDFRFNYSQA